MIANLFPFGSPIDGIVITRKISVGQVVDTGYVAFDISNLSTIWVTAAVNQQDLSLIHPGAAADVVTAGFPDQVFHGRVAMIGDTLDQETRTIPVRVVVPNPATKLRPGMFASAHIAEPETRVAVFVPEDALQNINGHARCLCHDRWHDLPGSHRECGHAGSMGQAEIVDGLKPGDRIVVTGAFMVKSEMLKGTMGDG